MGTDDEYVTDHLGPIPEISSEEIMSESDMDVGLSVVGSTFKDATKDEDEWMT